MSDSRLKGYGKPSVLLPGWKGQIYIDQLTGDEYECKGERGFIKVDGDDQDNQFNWVLKKQEKPFYEEKLITVDFGGPFKLVRISSEVLNDFASHAPSEGVEEYEQVKPINIWMDDGTVEHKLNAFMDDQIGAWPPGVYCIYRDNTIINSLNGDSSVYFPKSGTYLPAVDRNRISGIGYIDDETPRITWDGQTTKLKKLDEKFIPSRIIGIINDDLTFTADPSFDPSTMSVFDALASGKDLLYKRNAYTTTMKCVSWHERTDDPNSSNIGFYDPLNGHDYHLKWEVLSDGTVSITDRSVG